MHPHILVSLSAPLHWFGTLHLRVRMVCCLPMLHGAVHRLHSDQLSHPTGKES